ncbi:MAG: RNA ligase family protein [Bacteroidales bacterium]
MEFKKYSTIENSYQQDFIASIVAQGFGNLEYIVQEKVHGANLCFITDGSQIRLTSRTGLLDDEEKFFRSNLVLERYRERIIALSNEATR